MKYKFRGVDAQTEEWKYGMLLENSWGSFIVEHFSIINDKIETVIKHNVIPSTVGMWTGLKGIYEGDIDASKKHGRRVVVFDETLLCFVLIWVDYFEKYKEVGLVRCGCTYETVTANKKLNIIGNIYQTKTI